MTAELDRRAIRFPRSGHIWIPRDGHRAAAAGIAMHSACAPLSVLAQRVLYVGVRAFGSWIIPGARATWETPLPPDEWRHVLAEWRAEVGDFDGLALYHRPQAQRSGFSALLLQGGRGVGFARVHPDAARVHREFEIMTHIYVGQPTAFTVARPLASATTEQSTWMLSASVPNHPLGAVRGEETRRRISEELSAILVDKLDRPTVVPSHWLPAHGDFTPWNLRTHRSSTAIVIDWEDTGFAPPGTDLLYGALTAHTTFGSPLPASAPAEAASWIDRMIAARIAPHDTTGGDATLLRLLRSIPQH